MYDPRYLQGIDHFNRHEFFEAHDIWEDLWREMKGDDSRIFFQGLIQAAVALHHYRNGNCEGAWRMWGFSLERLSAYRPRHEGLNVDSFLAAMGRALEGLQGEPQLPFDPARVPSISLEP